MNLKEIFALQEVKSVESTGDYLGGKTVEEKVREFREDPAFANTSDEILITHVNRLVEEWATHKGQRLYFYMVYLKDPTTIRADVRKVWSGELDTLVGKYEHVPSASPMPVFREI